MKQPELKQEFKDKEIKCIDCGELFIFSAGEQNFYFSKQPPLREPKRCQACRDRRRRTILPWEVRNE